MIPSGVIFYHLSQRGLFNSSAKKYLSSIHMSIEGYIFLNILPYPLLFNFFRLFFQAPAWLCVWNSDILILKCFLLALFKYRKMSSKITVLLSSMEFGPIIIFSYFVYLHFYRLSSTSNVISAGCSKSLIWFVPTIVWLSAARLAHRSCQ